VVVFVNVYLKVLPCRVNVGVILEVLASNITPFYDIFNKNENDYNPLRILKNTTHKIFFKKLSAMLVG
jgi:hypothetical protein